MRHLQISSVDTGRYKSGISMLLGKWVTESVFNVSGQGGGATQCGAMPECSKARRPVEDNIFDWGKYRFLKFLITSLLSY